jgi:hypothetical protein
MKNCDKEDEKKIKSNMHFARHYKHLLPDYKMMGAYFFLFILPMSIIFLFNYSRLSKWISFIVSNTLSYIIPNAEIGMRTAEFIPYFGDFTYVILPSNAPTIKFAIINAIITIFFMIFFWMIDYKFKPLVIFLNFTLFYHLFTCGYVILTKGQFPYLLTEYSDLYMKQQLGIWLSFIIIAGLVAGYISHSGYSKYLMLISVLTYSLVFGVIRYIVFLALLYKFSSLFMTILFFGFGPFIDFLYLVSIYSIYMSHLTKLFGDGERGGTWHWA